MATECKESEQARLALLQVRDLLEDIQEDRRLANTTFEDRIESALREIETVT